jgi:LTXXQ motif family protein
MRRTATLLAALAAAIVAMPTLASAQDGFPGAVFRTLTTPFRTIGRTIAPRRTGYVTAPLSLSPAAKKRQQSTARATPRGRAAPIPAATEASRGTPDDAAEARALPPVAALERRPEARSPDQQQQPAMMASGWVGPLYWPYASDDLFDYAFQPSSSTDWFWARGSGDLFDAIFMRAGDARTGWAEMCGSRRGGSGSWIEPMRQAISPTQAQSQLFNDLRDALVKAANEVRSACPSPNTLANPAQRLEAMTDRLWALRQATITIRAPLEGLVGSLSANQQAKLNAIDADAAAPPLGTGNTPRPQANRPAALCGPPLSPFAEWPGAEIEQRVRPADEQRQALEALRMTTLGMTQFLMASCPSETLRTPLTRIDAAEKRLNALLYAARTLAPAVNGFYGALAEEQKAQFRSLGRLAGTARPTGEAPGGGRGER